jgi:hypothetical protein
MNRKPHPNSLRNLRQPWRPGESGNPEGKNIRRPFTDRYHMMSQAAAPPELIRKVNAQFKTPILAEGSSWAALTTARLYLQIVMKGDVNALREIVDRVEGKAPNRLDLMGMERQEITIRVVEDSPVARQGRASEVLFESLVNLVKTSPDEKIMAAAGKLALLLKGKPADVNVA